MPEESNQITPGPVTPVNPSQDPTVQEHIQKIAVLAEQVVDLMVAADCTIMDISLLTNSITTRFNPVFFNTTLKDMLVQEAALFDKTAPTVAQVQTVSDPSQVRNDTPIPPVVVTQPTDATPVV